jgi:hypothetical protein
MVERAMKLSWFSISSLGLCGALALTAACESGGSEWSGPLPVPDGDQFVNAVYPMLLRDCAFSTCHGAPERFFHVLGPGRTRLSAATMPDDPMTVEEVLYSYERSRSMLATSATIETSLLLRKPLEPAAGGQGHKGVDDFGRNVFESTRDPGYVTLSTWARTVGLPPTAASVTAANTAVAATQ